MVFESAFTCPICRKKFKAIQALYQHCLATNHCQVSDHHQTTNQNQIIHQNSTIKCPKYNRQFGTTNSLNQHLRSSVHQPTTNPTNKERFIGHTPEDQSFIKNLLQLHPASKLKRLQTHPHKTSNIDFGSKVNCPPHYYVIKQELVGYGPGNGGEQRTEEGIEYCLYCFRLRKDIEKEKE